MLAAAAVVSLVAGCSASEGHIYRVVGAESSCDDSACPPGTVEYSLRLARSSETADAAQFYDLADGVPHRDGVGAYPECVLAQIDGTRLKSWEPAACP